jgi:hypothetical protein
MARAMAKPPFELIWCSWPHAVDVANGCWISDPVWDAVRMPYTPLPSWHSVEGEFCWMVDWKAFFGEMRGFHVVFEIELLESGCLVFWADDGSVIERGRSVVVHEDRTAHRLQRNMITVAAGERLRIASWQLYGDWLWGARLCPPINFANAIESLLRFLPVIDRRLQKPSGPSLKIFTDGGSPARTVLSIYSMVLNGYAPQNVLLCGEHQWSGEARSLFHRCLPFAEIIETSAVRWAIGKAGASAVANSAIQAWWVMKTCVAFFTDPREFCMMDDDVFVLASVEDALSEFATADLVYQGDMDHSDAYIRVWGLPRTGGRLPTGRFNAGLYWMRNTFNAVDIARRMLRVSPERTWHVAWEQGFIATLFAAGRSAELPSQRYFYPLLDGLPGGTLGYDYRNNPCGFRTVHFGGLPEKPSDAVALWLADDILHSHGE